MFNNNSKRKNILLSSSFGVTEQLLSYFLAFIYRTVFLSVLSKNYLGISGLFSNVLQIFSLAELGIGSIISYRMYEPIKYHNIEKCAGLLRLYKTIYHCMFGIVLIMGCVFYPFLGSIIKDTSAVPADINLNKIYWLFVLQSAASYLFVYTQSVLNADQKGYVLSFANMIYNIFSNLVKILFLYISRNYTYVLFIGMIVDVIYNAALSLYIKHEYKEIVKNKSRLSYDEIKEIYKDTLALLCHKIGYTVVKSTDNIILSKYIGVTVLGIYSNYSFIANAIDTLLNKLLGSFVPTIGNMSIESNKNEIYEKYKQFRFVNYWCSSFCTICLFVLINPFIELWLDDTYLLNIGVVFIISGNLFLNSSRIINSAFVNGNGLFVKDRFRPLVESFLNLVISIFLVQRIGIAGVFIGTILSTLLTVWWREPIILYSNVFQRRAGEYFWTYSKWLFLTIILGGILYWLCNLFPVSILGFCIKLFVCVIVINAFYICIFYKSPYYVFLKKNLMKLHR